MAKQDKKKGRGEILKDKARKERSMEGREYKRKEGIYKTKRDGKGRQEGKHTRERASKHR